MRRCGEHAVLWKVHVCVDKAGDKKRIAVVVARQWAMRRRQARGVAAPQNPTVVADDQRAAAVMTHRVCRSCCVRVIAVSEHGAAQYARSAG